MKQIYFLYTLLSIIFIYCSKSICIPINNISKTGSLTVICGPMYAGKSEELIRIIRRGYYANKRILIIKHAFDTRTSNTDIASHNGTTITAHSVACANDIQSLATKKNYDIVCIDEVQFYTKNIIPLIMHLVDNGVAVIVSGLDQDFRGVPFGPMPMLLALANEVIKLTAICTLCGNPASKSQRLINGKPAKFDDPIVLIGAQESYQARCQKCFIIDKKEY